MSRNFAFRSGEYRKWGFYRYAGVPFYMRKLRVPGLEEAMKSGEIKSTTLNVNGVPMEWTNEKNVLFFKKILFRGNYNISFEIVYTEIL